MKATRLLACLLLVLLLASLCPAAFAEPAFNADDESLSGEIDATAFVAGSNPKSTADVKGILFSAGNSVSVAGSSEYAFVAGNMVSFTGECKNDAFITGNAIDLSGSFGRDLLTVGNQLNLHGSVGRDVYAAGKSIQLSGEFGGNVTLSAEEIVIDAGTKINGTLRYNSSAHISAPSELLSHASTYEEQKTDAPEISVSEHKTSPLSTLKSKLFSYVGLLLIAYFLLWLSPLWEKLDGIYAEHADAGRLAATFGIGLAVLVALPIASILLMITGFGLRPAFVLLLVYIAVILAAPIFVGFLLGVLVWRGLLKRRLNYWAELAIGLLVWCLLVMVPYVSFALRLVTASYGLGVITRLLGKKRTPPPVLTAQSGTEIAP